MKAFILSLASIILVMAAVQPPINAATIKAESTQPLLLAAGQSHHGIGTVTNVDQKGRRIEFKHGPVKSIGWMGMQMYFSVDDTELLDGIKVGDKVAFEFIETRDKRFVVIDIEIQ
ncbi:MAG: copper-binding protein [Gammaproteobacteria bacterium]|nr:copper-binding protein [Gammaproteobacteria bacterium]